MVKALQSYQTVTEWMTFYITSHKIYDLNRLLLI